VGRRSLALCPSGSVVGLQRLQPACVLPAPLRSTGACAQRNLGEHAVARSASQGSRGRRSTSTVRCRRHRPAACNAAARCRGDADRSCACRVPWCSDPPRLDTARPSASDANLRSRPHCGTRTIPANSAHGVRIAPHTQQHTSRAHARFQPRPLCFAEVQALRLPGRCVQKVGWRLLRRFCVN